MTFCVRIFTEQTNVRQHYVKSVAPNCTKINVDSTYTVKCSHMEETRHL